MNRYAFTFLQKELNFMPIVQRDVIIQWLKFSFQQLVFYQEKADYY